MGKSLVTIKNRMSISIIDQKFFSYPSTFIENQFRKFFPEQISTSPFLPFINDEEQFIILHKQFLNQPTTRQSQLLASATTANMEQDHTNNEPEDLKNSNNTTELKEKKQKKQYIPGDKLIVHYTHEKRFESFKRDTHTVYHDIFQNTPVDDIKMIVGNRNRPNARNELIRKRPKQSILTNQPIKSMP
jgi:hypothetical protein